MKEAASQVTGAMGASSERMLAGYGSKFSMAGLHDAANARLDAHKCILSSAPRVSNPLSQIVVKVL